MEMALTVPRYTVADLELLPDDGNPFGNDFGPE